MARGSRSSCEELAGGRRQRRDVDQVAGGVEVGLAGRRQVASPRRRARQRARRRVVARVVGEDGAFGVVGPDRAEARLDLILEVDLVHLVLAGDAQLEARGEVAAFAQALAEELVVGDARHPTLKLQSPQRMVSLTSKFCDSSSAVDRRCGCRPGRPVRPVCSGVARKKTGAAADADAAAEDLDVAPAVGVADRDPPRRGTTGSRSGDHG